MIEYNPLLGDILFWVHKINEIVNTFLLVGNKFMPKMHLKQPGFTYSACGPFTKNKKGIEELTKTRNKIDLDKDQKWSW